MERYARLGTALAASLGSPGATGAGKETNVTEIPEDPEPRQALLEALLARDAEQVDIVRQRYREWFVRNDDDTADRQPWPAYFESAVYKLVYGVSDRDERARTIGWARESASDARLADIADVFARTGLSRNPELWRSNPFFTAMWRSIVARDAEEFGRLAAACEEWAAGELAPWPEALLVDLELILHFILDDDGPTWDGVMLWALAGDDDRLNWLTHAARAFPEQPLT